jgi:hypothetical protein
LHKDPPTTLKISEKTQNAPEKTILPLKASKAHIFTTVTPILVILTPKFSETLPLSSYAFINTCLLNIDWFFVYFMLGNATPEPFFEDFHDQAFKES